MSALGQKQTFALQNVMSALPPKADICGAAWHVCFGPIADMGPALDEHSDARQDNPDFGELARLRIDLDRPAMLLDDDVVADGEAKTSTFSGRFGGEERVEHLSLHVRSHAGAVVADYDFQTTAKAHGGSSKGTPV